MYQDPFYEQEANNSRSDPRTKGVPDENNNKKKLNSDKGHFEQR